MRCEHCGRETPPGHYCAYCGSDLTSQAAHVARRRRHTFAANPHEHVYHPGIISTFFPHLNPHRMQQARWILLGGIIVIALIGLGRVVPVAIVAAAVFVPLLYLLYFFDVEVYENEPLQVLGATFAVGAILGAGMSLYFSPLLQRYLRPGFGPRPEYVLLHGIALPILAQALMLVGPLLLYFFRPRFDEVLDGLSFGVASGLGFAAAQSIVFSWLLIIGPTTQVGSATTWAIPTIRASLLIPLLDAGTTGLICAALWLWRDPQPAARGLGWLASLPVAVLLGVLGQVVPALGNDLKGSLVLSLVWYGAVLLVVMLLVRHVLHVALTAKARELGHGGSVRCPHCGHTVPDVPFCPHCGVAMRSTAKRERRSRPAAGPQAHEAPAHE
jgi:hypothetical protein